MDIWVLAFIGGITGSLFMDAVENIMSKYAITSGVKVIYVGRWAKGLYCWKFLHRDISNSHVVKNEELIGKLFHFIIGGGVVALFYPIFLFILGHENTQHHIILSISYGLLTCILPWLLLTQIAVGLTKKSLTCLFFHQ